MESDDKKISMARDKLRAMLDDWHSDQLQIFPALVDEFHNKITSAIYPYNPEDEPLLLPSNFSLSFRKYLGMDLATKIEKDLCIGRAHERLEEVRMAIQTYNHHIALKTREVRSQHHITREKDLQNNLIFEIQKPAYHYNKTHEMLLNLGLSSDDPTLRPLKDNELWAKNIALRSQPGDSRLEDPWIWNVATPSGLLLSEKKEFQQESKLFVTLKFK